MEKTGILQNPRLTHILSHKEQDSECFSLQYSFQEWFVWCSFIKSIFFAFIISSVSAYFGYTVEGGSIAVGKASTDSVVMSSVLILFSDLVLTQLLMG